MNPYYHPSTPLVPGSLHRLSAERDNCGMGAIAQIHGKRSYQILEFALCSVCNMTHRGAVDADMKTGDGSGILSQIPYPIFLKAAAKLGTTLENESDLAVAVFFLPLNDAAGQQQLKSMAEDVVTKRGIGIIGWREAPVDPDALGKLALATRPHIEHLLLKKPAGWAADHFERQLFLCRRSIERQTKGLNGFYMPSFSSRLISSRASRCRPRCARSTATSRTRISRPRSRSTTSVSRPTPSPPGRSASRSG
jgi:glutamate synthase (NADPH/NADH) large chain/glutamate synthase (ferredoxin)